MPRRPARALLCAALLCACGDDEATSSQSAGESSTGTSTAAGTTATSTDAATTGTTAVGSGSMSESAGTTAAPACDADAPLLAERGLLTVEAPALGVALDPCGLDRWYFVAPSESTLEITVRGQGPGVTALAAYPDLLAADAWADALTPPLESAADVPALHALAVPRSGEFALYVRPQDPQQGATYDLELRCTAGCERETTRFPLVWVHGWTGFENIGPLTYFFGVRDHIEPLGYPVSVAVLDPYNSSEVRGGQLAEQVDTFLTEWRARKVDLIGHSQGGVDSRYVISTLGYGDRVDALLTVASPHRGTYITDLALGLAPGGVEDALSFLFNLLGAVTAQAQSDAKASFYSLSETFMQGEFNPQNPDDPNVAYVSYTGRSCAAIDFIDPKNLCDDLMDPLLLWSYDILKLARGPNDGLVTLESAKWGDYRGEMIADHIDEVGQIAGVTDPDFDHLAWYLARVRDLAVEGH